jgi:hypothetical protein
VLALQVKQMQLRALWLRPFNAVPLTFSVMTYAHDGGFAAVFATAFALGCFEG